MRPQVTRIAHLVSQQPNLCNLPLVAAPAGGPWVPKGALGAPRVPLGLQVLADLWGCMEKSKLGMAPWALGPWGTLGTSTFWGLVSPPRGPTGAAWAVTGQIHGPQSPTWAPWALHVWPGSFKVWPSGFKVCPSSFQVWPSSSCGASRSCGAIGPAGTIAGAGPDFEAAGPHL